MSSSLASNIHFSRFSKNGTLLSASTYSIDSGAVSRVAVTPDDGTVIIGSLPPLSLDFNRLFITKLNANGTIKWTKTLQIPQPSGLSISRISTDVVVSNTGAILVSGMSGSTPSWYPFFVTFNADGIVQKAWYYQELMRPFITANRDGGFITALGTSATPSTTANFSNLLLLWLQPDGLVRQAAAYMPATGTTFIPLLRIAPLSLADSSIALLTGSTVVRLAKNGDVIWARLRSYQTTPGLNFLTTTTLINSTLSTSSRNKIYTMTSVFEVGFGLGKEYALINEFDVVTGDLRARALPNFNSRISSITELKDGKGFWVTADTLIPRGANTTKTIAGRLMRADTAFNAGCGPLIPINATALATSFQSSTPTIPTPIFLTIADAPRTTPLSITLITTILTKNECPSITNSTQDIDLPNILVYPNPSHGDFTIEAGDTPILSLKVFDLAGKLIAKIQNQGTQLPLSIEQAGTYFLDIQTAKGRVVKKIVKID